MTTIALTGAKKLLNEPLLSGALLFLLTRGPVHMRERLLTPLRSNLLATNESKKLGILINILRVLVGWGTIRRLNQALNTLAWNNWGLRRPGSSFRFGKEKEELIVITGGSSGFGYEMVKAFSRHARIVVFDVQEFPPELKKLSDVHFYNCDVTNSKGVEELCAEIRKDHGDPTVLINNAGIAVGKTVLETSNAECERLFQVNLISHFTLIRGFLPGMLRMRRGHIVTIASMASFVPASGLLDYCCSKVGALYLTEGIRAECLTHYEGGGGICTTSIHPSWHQTGILKGGEETLARHGIIPDPASNVSDVVVEQVLKGRSGRICVPRSEEGHMGIRSWPRWLQDILFGLVLKRKERFQFAKQDNGNP